MCYNEKRCSLCKRSGVNVVVKLKNILLLLAKFSCLVLYTLFFISTVVSDNFIVNSLRRRYIIVVIVSVICGVLYIAFRYYSSSFIKKIRSFFQIKLIKYSLAVLLISLQIIIALKLKAPTGFDPGGIMNQATYTSLSNSGQSYLSRYPNNLLLFFLEKLIFVLAGRPSAINFLAVLIILNIVVLDLTIVINYLILNIFNPKKIQILIFGFLSITFFVFTPWIIVFYSDTLVLLPNSILCYLLLTYFRHSNTKWYLLRGLEIGITLWFAYHLKPTSVIILLAGVIVLILSKSIRKTKIVILLLSSLILATSFIVLQQEFTQLTNQQKIVHLDRNARFTAVHFMMMGLQKTGRYSRTDVINSINQPTVSKRTAYNKKIIFQRLKAFGVKGYIKFLIKKNYYNTSDGTLGWGKEGNFLIDHYPTQHRFIKSFFYPNAQRQIYYRVFCQVVWVFVSFGILLTISISGSRILMLQLAFAGLLLFLLLFEGGRSRYLIQFLPIILMLASIGYARLADWLKHRLCSS